MKNGNIWLSAVILVFAASFAVPFVTAQNEACKADTAKFCKDAQGMPAKMKCLKSHEAEVSKACKARIAEWEKNRNRLHPCKADAEMFCKGLKRGDPMRKCMKANEPKLSAGCKAAIAAMKEELRGNKTKK
jgi:hypothetical protein